MGDVVVGPLARSILDRNRGPGWALIVSILERTRTSPPGREVVAPDVVDGLILDERDLVRETISADGWVTLGVVRHGASTVFLEVSVRSGDARLLFPPNDWTSERPWNGILIPAEAFRSLGGPAEAG